MRCSMQFHFDVDGQEVMGHGDELVKDHVVELAEASGCRLNIDSTLSPWNCSSRFSIGEDLQAR